MRKFLFSSFLLLLYLVTGCAGHSNTSSKRLCYAFMTRYNIYHHANENYKQALKQKGSMAGKDSIDPDKMLDEAIRKCRKGIELYSIREKPRKRKGWQRDPKQRALQNRTEYNPFIGNCWLLMGKSYYYKEAYKEAFLTLSYIKEHFKEKEKIVREAILWENKSLFALQEKYVHQNNSDKYIEKDSCLNFSYYHPYSFYFFSPQDSLYNRLYNTYSSGDIPGSLTICREFYDTYPEDTLTPSFVHIENLSLVSIDKKEHIPIHAVYPVIQKKTEREFHSFFPLSTEGSSSWYLLFLSPVIEKTEKELLFEISTINFFQLLQKQIDTEINHFGTIRVIILSGFKTLQEIQLYQEKIAEKFMSSLFSTESQLMPVTHENYKKIQTKEDLLRYRNFYLSEITGE